MRTPAILTSVAALLLAAASAPMTTGQCTEVPSDQRAALEAVSVASLTAHVSFLAADELGGRATPSPGLDAAAAYIASRFRQAGVEPVGDDGYYDTSFYVAGEPGRRGRPRLQRVPSGERPPPGAVRLKNVVGMVRGADPDLRDTYLLVTAHYDHVGIRTGATADSIYNGANDNASGTAGVIELARVLGEAGVHPRRSILFVAFFGEESGLLGARAFVEDPPVPLESIVGVMNLEQIGRTDGDGGDNTGRANLTGFALSDFVLPYVEAGRAQGVELFRHAENSLPYFRASDNIAFASAGVVAHTLSVVYAFEQYHQAGDHWDLFDYENMARTVRTIGLGTLMWANCDEVPAWDAANENAARYLEAWRGLHGGG